MFTTAKRLLFLLAVCALILTSCAPQSTPLPAALQSTPTETPATAVESVMRAAVAPTRPPSRVRLEALAYLGGRPGPMALSGSYLYAWANARLQVVDLSQPRQPRIVGQSDPIPDLRNLQAAGSRLYFQTGDSELHIYNLDQPLSPRSMGSFAAPGLQFVQFTVVDPYVYLLTTFSPATGGELVTRLSILQVEDPADPHQVSSLDLPGQGVDFALNGSTLYVTYQTSLEGSGGLHVVDVSDPTTPVRTNSLELGAADGLGLDQPNQARFLFVMAYNVQRQHDTVRVFDLSDPTKPASAGEYDPPGDHFTRLRVFSQSPLPVLWLSGQQCELGNCSDVQAYVDLSNPRALQPANPDRLPLDAMYPQGLAFQGLLLQLNDTGLEVRAPAQSEEESLLASLPLAIGPLDEMTVRENWAYAYYNLAKPVFRVIDLENLSNPVELGGMTFTLTRTNEFATTTGQPVEADGFAFVNLFQNGLSILDVRSPAQPIEVARIDFSGKLGSFALAGRTLYLQGAREANSSQAWRTLYIYNLTNMAGPELVTKLDGFGGALSVVGDHLYQLCAYKDCAHTLSVYDISEPGSPHLLSAVDAPGADHLTLDASGTLAYLTASPACSTGAAEPCQNQLWVYDLSDLSHPQQLTSLTTEGKRQTPPSKVWQARLAGDYLFWGGDIWDVSNPAAPLLAGANPYPDLLETTGNLIYAHTPSGGVVLLRVSPK